VRGSIIKTTQALPEAGGWRERDFQKDRGMRTFLDAQAPKRAMRPFWHLLLRRVFPMMGFPRIVVKQTPRRQSQS
jgi:hypothetical protein